MLKILFIIWLSISVITFALLFLEGKIIIKELKTTFPNATPKYSTNPLKKVAAFIEILAITFLPILNLLLLLIIIFQYDTFEDTMTQNFCEKYYLE